MVESLPGRCCFPWRSAVLGWLVASAFLIVGVPLFLRMPLWCDATLHAVAARAIATGGVHYRDVFETNPPGFAWALCAVHAVLGAGSDALRVADLAVVVLVTSGLLWWVRSAGGRCADAAWTAAAVMAFYLFAHEFNHVQRDVWMMLPAGMALVLRLGRCEWKGGKKEEQVSARPGPSSVSDPTPQPPPPRGEGETELADPRSDSSCSGVDSSNSGDAAGAVGSISPSPLGGGGSGVGSETDDGPERKRSFGISALFEGFLWGLGCWIKPHLMFVAAAAWLASRSRLSWRDHLSVFVGGVAAGIAGLLWLTTTGAWPYFIEIWRTWNASYLATVMSELPFRLVMELQYFPPYSVCAMLAVPLALANLRDRSDKPTAFCRRVLAAVYLAWLFMALLLQRPFHYIHVPETLLMLAVFAVNRWAMPFVLVLVPAFASAVFALTGWNTPYVPPHPAFDANRTQWWATCFDANPPREARRGVALYANSFSGNDPVELGAVADYLRTQNLHDGELIAWHDSPHALYLDLGIKPRFRFMHVDTASGLGKWQEAEVLRELQAAIPYARFVVSDMHRVTERYGELNDLDANGLPKVLPAWQRSEFPFDQPMVFRSPSGRYLVHRIAKPVTSARIPQRLDQAEPNSK
jgi:hypothetical protein